MTIRLDFTDPHGGSGRLRCAFATPLRTLVAHQPGQVKPLLDTVQSAAQSGLWCVGYVRYEAAGAFDSALQTHSADGVLAWFGVFEQALKWPEDASDEAAQNNTTLHLHGDLTRTAFAVNMASIHQAIATGECYQINYTTLLRGEFSGNASTLFERLQMAQPGGYAAFIDTGDEQVLSVSPELFFDWNGSPGGGHILTRPMKGTAARGATAEEDAAQIVALTCSVKERAENVMIVDLLRNDLSRIARLDSVKVPTLFTVQSLPTVHQMVSDVTAQTRPGTSLADVFGALFPCGSITGAPKVRAMQKICALEPTPRGVYCGAIGVIRPGGHATFNVAIRTVTLRGSHATCGVGSGITADATTNAEWQEWQIKQRFLARASQTFRLLETLRLECGALHNLAAHLARLQRAAKHFDYPFDAARIKAALDAQCGTKTDDPTPWRVRLQLNAGGTPSVELFRQDDTTSPVHIALAVMPFAACDSEFTRFKTTRRTHYDAFAPVDPTVFDTLLYNPRGELIECTRGNIAFKLDGQWVTPPLHCGLLDGVGREMALQEGRLREAVVRVQDLPRVQALAFINSLRGWLQARLV